MVAKNKHYRISKCPVACALDIIGDHWSLLIIRDLMFFCRHEYKDILTAEEKISSGILSDRLDKLKHAGLITSIQHRNNKRRKFYYLTDSGKDLIFVMLDIARWSDKHLGDRVFIPEDKRPSLDNPPEIVAEMVLQKLAEWEEEHLP